MFLCIFDVGMFSAFSCTGKGLRARVIVAQRFARLLLKCAKQGRAKVIKHQIFPSVAPSTSRFIHCLKTSFGILLPAFGPVHSHD